MRTVPPCAAARVLFSPLIFLPLPCYPPSPRPPPPKLFLDSISRLPRDRIVETAGALFRVSCHEDEGAGCGATTVRRYDMWQMKGAVRLHEERKTNRFSCGKGIVFARDPRARDPARILISCLAARESCAPSRVTLFPECRVIAAVKASIMEST
jgi:hypothetical protein